MPAETPDLRARLLEAARAELIEHGPTHVSLRAVARRAGVSHAAPAYSFGDREGMLTAVVAEGFRALARDLEAPVPPDDGPALAVLGRRYVGFAAANPALYELMFRPGETDAGDPDLLAARRAALRGLVAATAGEGGEPSDATVISWALAHGLANLGTQGALGLVAEGVEPADLIDAFARMVALPS